MRMLIGAAAAAAALAASGEEATKGYVVKWVGELHEVMKGKDAGVISLAEFQDRPHLYAIGPLEGLDGEITVLDGAPSIATVKEGRPFVRRTFEVRAPLLVWAQVDRWKETPIPPTVTNLSELAAFVETTGRSSRLEMGVPFPFRVTGTARSGSMHIVNRQGREAAGHAEHEKIELRLPLADVAIELIGFWSDHHQGVFTHMGSTVHVHGRTVDGSISGHLDEVALASARLWLPSPD